VPIIAIPLAFRRAAACAVKATNGPAVQSLTWTRPPHGSIFLISQNRKPIDREVFDFAKAEN
jgi:hypothetical protein